MLRLEEVSHWGSFEAPGVVDGGQLQEPYGGHSKWFSQQMVFFSVTPCGSLLRRSLSCFISRAQSRR